MSNLISPEGTQRYAKGLAGRVASDHFRPWPSRPGSPETLLLSSLGMGSYTGPEDAEGDRQYRESVKAAVKSGINVIDCSINYRHMRSERALGAGLRELFAEGLASRDEVFLMSKGGYLPFDGNLPENPGSYLRKTYFDSGILRPEEVVGGCHSIAPRYLEDQLERSLRNFGLPGLDVYFLHNVEQQLDEVPVPAFLDRVRAAFQFLEGAAEAGKIGLYGVATWNGLRVPPDRKGHLSLEDLLQVATEVGGAGHHFRVVQLPYNLGMPEALTLSSQRFQGGMASLLTLTQAHDLIVVTSVPLLQTQLLSHVPEAFAGNMPGLSTQAQRAIQFVRSTPGVLAPLIGMKSLAHVQENSAIAAVPPLTADQFRQLLGS